MQNWQKINWVNYDKCLFSTHCTFASYVVVMKRKASCNQNDKGCMQISKKIRTKGKYGVHTKLKTKFFDKKNRQKFLKKYSGMFPKLSWKKINSIKSSSRFDLKHSWQQTLSLFLKKIRIFSWMGWGRTR